LSGSQVEMDARIDSPLCLVTGATGVIGSQLVQALVATGLKVRVLVRQCPPPSLLPPEVTRVKGDLLDPEALRKATRNIDTVFHLAAKVHIHNPSSALKNEYQRINVDGTECLAEAALAANVKRLIFFSTINVYGPTQPGSVYDENSELNPDSIYAHTKAQGEQIVRESVPSVILRLAAVYGPQMKGNYLRLLNALRKKRFVVIGDGFNRRTVVHVEDVCRAALTAAEHPAAVGEIYNVTDGEVHKLQEIIEAMSAALGQSPPFFRVPARSVRAVAALVEDGLNLVGKQSPVGRATVDKFTEDIAVCGAKLQRQLGFRPKYDLATGWKETVRQLAEQQI
jgi:UDP-glucose 4-epimerase